MDTPKRILITRTDRLGDVVLSTPVIRHMRKLYPEAYIAFMVRPENKDVVLNNPHLDEVILYDKYGIHRSLVSTVQFAMRLKKKKFDTAIALHPTNRAHIMLMLAGIPVRIGYDRNLGALLTMRIGHTKQEGVKHEVDYNFDLIEKAGFNVAGAERKPYIMTSPDEKKLVDSVLRDRGIGGNIIAMHVGASCPSKRWPSERFARAAELMAAKYGCDLVLVGGDETSELSSEVASMVKARIFDLTGELLVGELAEFLSRCALFVSNDSGPVHIAVAMDTPVVAIFGRKDPGLSPKRWKPLGARDKVVHKAPGCDICLAHGCDKGFACLKAVSVEDVIFAADMILDRTGPA